MTTLAETTTVCDMTTTTACPTLAATTTEMCPTTTEMCAPTVGGGITRPITTLPPAHSAAAPAGASFLVLVVSVALCSFVSMA
jgi:hypothetical protein